MRLPIEGLGAFVACAVKKMRFGLSWTQNLFVLHELRRVEGCPCFLLLRMGGGEKLECAAKRWVVVA